MNERCRAVQRRAGRSVRRATKARQLSTVRRRRGQTLILALGVMFLLLLVGAVFVLMVTRNLARASRGRAVSRSESLAWAGVRFAADQFKASLSGAEWFPTPTEDLWRTPNPLTPAAAAARLRDPDYVWLSDGGAYRHPYIRYRTGEGRFLLRVRYRPSFHQELPDSRGYRYPHAFDPNSALIHVESIGRPGVVEPTDPTTLLVPGPNWSPGQILGEFRKVEAWVPVGLTEQLLWITNRSQERGPATIGVAPLRDGNGNLVNFDDDPNDGLDDTGTQYCGGGLKSGVDLQMHGDVTFRLFPARGETVQVNGRITHFRSGNTPARVKVVLHDDSNDPDFVDQQVDVYNGSTVTFREDESGTPAFNPILDPDPGRDTYLDGRGSYLDNEHLDNIDAAKALSIRNREAPLLDQEVGSTGVARYVQLTRDSGDTMTVTSGGETRTINSGYYGFGQGLYFDNFGDVQYPGDRKAVLGEWLQNGQSDVRRTGWVGPIYIPSVRELGTVHPVLELEFAAPDEHVNDHHIHATRFDSDARKMNFGRAAGRTRIFYDRNFNPVGPSSWFPYPRTGVIFCEGSVRVRGILPANVQTTLVSGNNIYIEGNILRTTPASFLGLLANDHVTLNPTAFFRIDPGPDGVFEADLQTPGQDPRSWHYSIPQNGELDLEFLNVAPVAGFGSVPGAYLLHVEQTGQSEDTGSNTLLSIFANGLGPGNLIDFAGYPPPYPRSNTSDGADSLYRFFFFPPVANAPWNYSNFQSQPGGSVNYERKSFWVPTTGPTPRMSSSVWGRNFLKFLVRPSAQGQPYWLGRVAAIPYGQPLRIEVHAVVYAQNGSWFIIPPPYFNQADADSRAAFRARSFLRANGVKPDNAGHYPFFHEPLNIEIDFHGAITENLPADPADRSAWTTRIWMKVPEVTDGARQLFDQETPGFRPRIRYFYEHDLRRYVRYRILNTGQEGVAYVGPSGGPISYVPPTPTLAAVIQLANQQANSYVVTMPILPRLPAGPVLYEGSVVQ